jgi:hypothetical protein
MAEIHKNYAKACVLYLHALNLFCDVPLYTSIRYEIQLMFSKRKRLNPTAPLLLAFEIVVYLLANDAKRKGVNLDNLIPIIDLFCFDYDYCGPSESFDVCLELHQQLTARLFQIIHETYVQELEIVMPGSYRVMDSPIPIARMMRYTESTSIIVQRTLLAIIDVHKRNLGEHLKRVVEMIVMLYEVRMTNFDQRHHKVYFIQFVNEVITKLVAEWFEMNSQDYYNSAMMIVARMISAGFKCTELLSQQPGFHHYDYYIVVRLLSILAAAGAFNRNPDEFWSLAYKHLSPRFGDMYHAGVSIRPRYMLFAMLILDHGIWNIPFLITPESERYAREIEDNLITHQLEMLKTPSDAQQLLNQIREQKWDTLLIDQTLLNGVLTKINRMMMASPQAKKLLHLAKQSTRDMIEFLKPAS